jgi:hypothetical protein
MTNTISEHLAKFYNWKDDEKANKIIFLSTLVSVGGFFSFLLVPTVLAQGRRFALMLYCVVVIITSLCSLI